MQPSPFSFDRPGTPAPGASRAGGTPREAATAVPAILLIDDDPDCRLLMKDAICEAVGGELSASDERLCLYEVPDGEAALRFLRRQGEFADVPRPALIYLDLEMPGMGGMAALANIRAEPDLLDIPVIMFTGVCDPGPMGQAARLGANSYLIKPADAERLLRTVFDSARYWLGVHQSPRRTSLAGAECRRLPARRREPFDGPQPEFGRKAG